MGSCIGPKINASDLLFLVDAGNDKSYVGSGTTNVTCLISGISGTRINGTGFSSANGGSFFFGAGGGLTTQNIYFSNDTPLNPSGDCTICIWVKVDNLLANFTYINKYAAVAGNPGWIINSAVQTGNYIFGFTKYDNVTPQIRGQTTILNTSWQYMCFNPTIATDTTYRNGVSVSYNPGTTWSSIAGTHPFYIGNNAASTKQVNISQVQIYNKILSAAEVLQNYNSQKSRYGL
jgi:hypothetical protein